VLVYKEIGADESSELSRDVDELDPKCPVRELRLSDEPDPWRGAHS
jgi:hypothetical protein